MSQHSGLWVGSTNDIVNIEWAICVIKVVVQDSFNLIFGRALVFFATYPQFKTKLIEGLPIEYSTYSFFIYY